MIIRIMWLVLACVLSLAFAVDLGPDNAPGCVGRQFIDSSYRLSQDALESPLLKYAMNTAVNRAIFYSVIYNWTAYEIGFGRARRVSQQVYEDHIRQPGVNYIYMSTEANVQAGPPGVQTSGLFFDHNSAYPNWLLDVSFNRTVKLFGVRADHGFIKDMGNTHGTNYSNRAAYPQNQFFEYLQDTNNGYSFQHYYVMKYHTPGQTPIERIFSIKEIQGETGRFTPAFYDCGQTNTWLVNSVSMATELLARSTVWQYLRRLRSVAASTVGVSKDVLDAGNFAQDALTPTRLAQGRSALVTHDVTSCSNLASPNTPVPLANNLWTAEHLALTLETQGRAGLRLSHFLSNFLQNSNYSDNAQNDLIIQRAWREWRYTEPEQIFDPTVLIKVDYPLTYKQLSSEAFALLMSDEDISSVGIYLDAGVFPERSDAVAVFAWKAVTDRRGERVEEGNIMDPETYSPDFTSESWYTQARQAFSEVSSANTESYTVGRTLRFSKDGEPTLAAEALTYVATTYDQGLWMPPQFLCGPNQAGWVTSYVTPIFVREAEGQDPVFGGVVKVDAVFTERNISP